MSENLRENLRETQAPSPTAEFREGEGAKVRKPVDRVFALVFVILAANAATAFLIQAWMTYGFAKEVWELPRTLCFALIVALDLFAVMYMVLTYLLRSTGWPRFVATVVFLFAVGAQVFAAELYGEHEGWTTEVRWFAALPAVFLALAQEGVILWRSHRNDLTRVDKPADLPPAPTKPQPVRAAPVASEAPRKERPETGKTQVKPPAPRSAALRKEARKDEVPESVARVLAGETPAVVAASLGKTTRAVQIRVQNWRKQHPDLANPANATPEPSRLYREEMPRPPLTSPNIHPINGNAPEVEVSK
jgi:hypothetical protein